MSTFAVEVRTLDKISEHPKADRLEIGNVRGLTFNFVIQKGSYKIGDKVVFFPEDSILPQELREKMGITFLAGVDSDIVKTVCLRGVYSQGLVLPCKELVEKEFLSSEDIIEGNDVTKKLGVTKYEVEPMDLGDCTLIKLPPGVKEYDIEGCERHQEVLDRLMTANTNCLITEKMEGTNFSVSVYKDGSVFVNQANWSIQEHDGVYNKYWDTARKLSLIDKAICIRTELDTNMVTIYGELVGPGVPISSFYRFPELKVLVFDIKTENGFLDVADFFKFTNPSFGYDIETVPVLYMGPLKSWLNTLKCVSIDESSNGKSVFGTYPREGIVIKPLIERRELSLGRVILKKRSPVYLGRS